MTTPTDSQTQKKPWYRRNPLGWVQLKRTSPESDHVEDDADLKKAHAKLQREHKKLQGEHEGLKQARKSMVEQAFDKELQTAFYSENPLDNMTAVLHKVAKFIEAQESLKEHSYQSQMKALTQGVEGFHQVFASILALGQQGFHLGYGAMMSPHQQYYSPLADSVMFNPVMLGGLFGGGFGGPYGAGIGGYGGGIGGPLY